MVQRVFLALVIVSLLPFAGCGTGGPVEYVVSGTVTFEGQPLPDGNIIFESADRKAQDRAEKIVNGKYQFTAPLGPKVVRILATREEGERDKVMNMVARKQYIPPQYNSTSELKAEVTSDPAKNVFDFNLKSDKPASATEKK